MASWQHREDGSPDLPGNLVGCRQDRTLERPGDAQAFGEAAVGLPEPRLGHDRVHRQAGDIPDDEQHREQRRDGEEVASG